MALRGGNPSGAFYQWVYDSSNQACDQADRYFINRIYFDASSGTYNINGVKMDISPYGKSDTVMPANISMLPLMKINNREENIKQWLIDQIRAQFTTDLDEIRDDINYNKMPVGTIIPLLGTTDLTDKGFLPCDGQNSYTKANYPELCVLLSGGTVTSFKTPNLTGRFLEGATTEIGTLVDAGLPNISGFFDGQRNGRYGDGDEGTSRNNDDFNYGGPFTITEGIFRSTHGDDDKSLRVNFDASLVSNVYKNGITTVQPKSIKVKYWIKY